MKLKVIKKHFSTWPHVGILSIDWDFINYNTNACIYCFETLILTYSDFTCDNVNFDLRKYSGFKMYVFFKINHFWWFIMFLLDKLIISNNFKATTLSKIKQVKSWNIYPYGWARQKVLKFAFSKPTSKAK